MAIRSEVRMGAVFPEKVKQAGYAPARGVVRLIGIGPGRAACCTMIFHGIRIVRGAGEIPVVGAASL